MTAPQVEARQGELTPAQQAMAVALALALAAEQGVEKGAGAYAAGRIGRPEFLSYVVQQVLRGIAQASTAGQRYAEAEWQHRATPQLIREADQQRIEQAVGTITEGEDTQVTGRSTRLARAETITAGRAGYVGAVAQAVAGDPDYVWRFSTDADPCGRCVELAGKTFEKQEDAPARGAHPSCSCTLSALLRDED